MAISRSIVSALAYYYSCSSANIEKLFDPVYRNSINNNTGSVCSLIYKNQYILVAFRDGNDFITITAKCGSSILNM